MYGNEYSSVHHEEIENIKKKIESRQRALDAITTVKGYKDPATKLVKAQEYYKTQLENRPRILEGKCKEIEDKINLRKNRKQRDLNDVSSRTDKAKHDFEKREAMLLSQLEECRRSYELKKKTLDEEVELLESKYNSEINTLENKIDDIKLNDPESQRLEREIDSLTEQILNARTNTANKTELVIIEELKALRAQLKDAERQYTEAIEAQEFLSKKEKETKVVQEEMWHPWCEFRSMKEEEEEKRKEVKKNNRLYPEGKPADLPKPQDVVLEQLRSALKTKEVEEQQESQNTLVQTTTLPAPLISDTKKKTPPASKKVTINESRPFRMSDKVLAVEKELEQNRGNMKREGLSIIEEQRRKYKEQEARLKQLYNEAEISRDELEERLKDLRAWKIPDDV